jgi:alkylation response protein AidB-like acyl-CoA dehydrogenase
VTADTDPGAGPDQAAADRATGRAEIHAELARCLDGFQAGAATLLGAGNDDIEVARDYLRRLAPGGWAVPSWPPEYGGRGLGREPARAVAAELGRFGPPDLYPFHVGLALVGPALLRHGTPGQLSRWLPDIARGASIWCQLFSEPGAGSDLAGLACRAERADGGWRLTGQKVWSSRSAYADLGIALARFDPSLPKHAGIIALVVDMHAPGVSIRPLRQMNGDSHFSEVFLDGVFVPERDQVAAPGDGWSVARTVLALERATFGAEGSGTGTGLRARLLDLVRDQRHGTGADPARVEEVVRLWCDLEVAKLTSKRAAALAASGQDAAAVAAGAKLRMGQNLRSAARLATGLTGLGGLEPGGFFAELLLTAPSLSIRGGTDEIARNTIGEQVLGLPREPRADAGPFNAPAGAAEPRESGR